METIDKTQKTLGFALGIGFGILVDTTIFLWQGPLVVMVIFSPVVILLIAPFWLGIEIGKSMAKRNSFRNISKRHIWIVISIGWPLCIFIPNAFRMVQVNLWARDANNILSREIPVYTDSYLLDKAIEKGNVFSTAPRARIKYESHGSPTDILNFYEKELAIHSWKTDPINYPSYPILGYQYVFTKDDWKLSLTVSKNYETDGRSVLLELRALSEKY